MPRRRTSAVLFALAVAAGLSSCSDLTGSNCSYTGNAAAIQIFATNGVTGGPPDVTPVIEAVSSDGKITDSGAGFSYQGTITVSVYVPPGTYTVSIITPGYQTINEGKIVIADDPNASCGQPLTQSPGPSPSPRRPRSRRIGR